MYAKKFANECKKKWKSLDSLEWEDKQIIPNDFWEQWRFLGRTEGKYRRIVGQQHYRFDRDDFFFIILLHRYREKQILRHATEEVHSWVQESTKSHCVHTDQVIQPSITKTIMLINMCEKRIKGLPTEIQHAYYRQR